MPNSCNFSTSSNQNKMTDSIQTTTPKAVLVLLIKHLTQELLDKLRPFNTIKHRPHMAYYKIYKNGKSEELDSDYDTCNRVSCTRTMRAKIRAEYRGHKVKLFEWDISENSSSCIKECNVCYSPISSSLDEIEQEIEHYLSMETIKIILLNKRDVYDVVVLLDSILFNHTLEEYTIDNLFKIKNVLLGFSDSIENQLTLKP